MNNQSNKILKKKKSKKSRKNYFLKILIKKIKHLKINFK